MAAYSKNVSLLKKDPLQDRNDTFNITTMLNENWDKIDLALPFKVPFDLDDWQGDGTGGFKIEVPRITFTASATLGAIAYAHWYRTVNNVLTPIDKTWLGVESYATIENNKLVLHTTQAFTGAAMVTIR